MKAEVDNAKRRLTLHVSGEEDRELEEWTVRAKSELLRDVFDLEVNIAERASRPSSRPEPAASPASRPPAK